MWPGLFWFFSVGIHSKHAMQFQGPRMVLLSLGASHGSREGIQQAVPGGLRLNWSVHRAGEMPLPTHMVLSSM